MRIFRKLIRIYFEEVEKIEIAVQKNKGLPPFVSVYKALLIPFLGIILFFSMILYIVSLISFVIIAYYEILDQTLAFEKIRAKHTWLVFYVWLQPLYIFLYAQPEKLATVQIPEYFYEKSFFREHYIPMSEEPSIYGAYTTICRFFNTDCVINYQRLIVELFGPKVCLFDSSKISVETFFLVLFLILRKNFFILYYILWWIISCTVGHFSSIKYGKMILASPPMYRLSNVYHFIMLHIILIFSGVAGLLFKAIVNFSNTRNKLAFNLSLPRFTEFIWTLYPMLVVGIILHESLDILYEQDAMIDPLYTFKVIGYQWYWSYDSELVRLQKNYDVYNVKHTLEYIPEEIHTEQNIISNWLYNTEFNESFHSNSIFSYIQSKNYILNYEEHDSLLARDKNLPPIYNALMATSHRLLPVREYLRILCTSNDVIHSWAVPALGIKIDAIPGRLNQVITYIWYPGIYFGQCSEICGTNHSFMPITIFAIKFFEPDQMNMSNLPLKFSLDLPKIYS